MTSIGILSDLVRPEEKMIMQAAEKAGAKVSPVDISRISFELASNGKGGLEEFDVFLQRSVSTLKGLYACRMLEEKGLLAINDFQSSQNCIDKAHCSMILARNKIPTPRTIACFSQESGLEAFERIGYPAVIKPVMGSWARLVAKINDSDAAKAVLEDRQGMGALGGIFYIQEFVKKPQRDIRALVIGGKAVCAIYRVNDRDWITNTARGGIAENCPLSKELEEISIRAANAMGDGIFGVDVMESEKGLLVHEVNHSPEFKNMQRVTGKDIASEIVDFALSKARR